ncbi:MAG: YihY/virulence factor BrkB family protein [Mycobacteriales bacterium]
MRGDPVASMVLAVLRACVRHRTNGHAAETAFFALLSLVPATITLGGVLHLFAKVGGPDLETRGQRGAAATIRVLIGPKLADSVVNPFVRTQLEHSEGLAVTGLLVSAWLTSRAFYAITHGIDVAYGVAQPRNFRVQRLIALGYAVAAVVLVAVTLAIMVLGWHSGRANVDRFFGRTPVVAQLWMVARWPLLLVVLLVVLVGLYRYGANVRHTWRQCLPGAAVALALWIGAAALFRAYVLFGTAEPTGVHTNDEQVVLIGRAIGATIGTGIWMYFSALAVLLGAEFNGVLVRRHQAAEVTAATAGSP